MGAIESCDRKMAEQVYYDVVDKSRWLEGPWKSEPDKEVWIDAETGLDCMIRRGGGGALCGYVGIPEGHPCFGLDDRHEQVYELEVHGGINFASPCQEGPKEKVVCHTPESERPDTVWWLGFDCGHYCDFMPEHQHLLPPHLRSRFSVDGVYRDCDYVKQQCVQLAQQLAAMVEQKDVAAVA